MIKQGFTAFDIDGTIWPLDIENMWLHQLVDDGALSPNAIEENEKFLNRHMEGRFDEDAYLEFFLSHFLGWNISKLQKFSDKVFNKFATSRLYKEANSAINQLKEKGEFVFLLTAANNIAAAPFGKYFELDVVVSTELEFDNNILFTGNIIGPYCYGNGKVIKTQALCSRYHLNLEMSTYYGDSPSDIPMFEYMKQAVVVNPTTELEELARKSHWDVVRWGI